MLPVVFVRMSQKVILYNLKQLESWWNLVSHDLKSSVLQINTPFETRKEKYLFSFLRPHWSSPSLLAGINLCSNNNGDCSQLCLPTSLTSRACMCTAGYSLKTGQQSCEGKILRHSYSHTCSHTYSWNAVHPKNKNVLSCLWAGMGSFLLYSVHEGIRGIPLDPADKSDALVPVSGTSLAVGIDFHAGEWHWGTLVPRWHCLRLSLSQTSEIKDFFFFREWHHLLGGHGPEHHQQG